MELQAWRQEVAYGAHLQPIHLRVAASASADSGASSVQVSQRKTARNDVQSRRKSREDAAPEPEATVEASNGVQSSADKEQTTEDDVETLVLPPFGSECMQDGQQMALNVGGPVWAMDWLPTAVEADTAPVSVGTSKQKKPRKQVVSVRPRRGRAVRGKENNRTEETADPVEEESKAGVAKSGGLEWRFLALSTHPPCQVVDGKVVKPTPPDHYYDVPEAARNLVQIWAVPVQMKKTSNGEMQKKGNARKTVKRSLVKPRMVYAIDHESGVAWDMQWCPLVKNMPESEHRRDLLGVLAVCFGDGSVRIFEVPTIPQERLKPQPSKKSTRIVETNVPVVIAVLPRIMQLSVQWSPFHWNLLLTGGSDGSVSLWNILSDISEHGSSGKQRTEPEPIEPLRRFQDADTIGKQEAFDWGCGWVAIRAVAWSPFDEHLFATTGNDSVFKVWDVREPRLCLRSHRIRSTWGLALQWMDQTSIQISGDQGSIYMYDILSGSYQKLHFHPQIDSPVWDLQFGRRGAVPLLVSSCTSGSIRTAPARKLYRAPQNCVEICRLSGSKDASVEQPFKSLTVSFEKTTILGSGDTVSSATREFCERDAALHRLRVTSSTVGVYPCYLAAAGHAGLVLLLELQEVLDNLINTYFLPPSKKIGRPKKMFAPVGAHRALKKSSNKTNAVTISVGRKARTLGSFVKAKGMHTALSKYKKTSAKAKSKAKRSKAKTKSFIQEDGDVEMLDDVDEEEEEPEYEEEDDEASDSELSLVIEDNSDDDAISISDDNTEEEASTPEVNPEESRLMTEYQLDLSEEDAYLLAIQMSQADTAPAVGSSQAPAKSASVSSVQEPAQNKDDSNGHGRNTAEIRTTSKKPISNVQTKARAQVKLAKGKKRARPSKAAAKTGEKSGAADDADIETAQTIGDATGRNDGNADSTTIAVGAAHKTKQVTRGAAAKSSAAKKGKQLPKAASTRKEASHRQTSVVDQAMALQMFNFQMGLSEEDALKEAIRLSEMEDKPEVLPTPTRRQKSPGTPRSLASHKKQGQAKEPQKVGAKSVTTSADEATQPQRPQPPRRLHSSPQSGNMNEDSAEVPAADIDDDTQAQEGTLSQTSSLLNAAVASAKKLLQRAIATPVARSESVEKEKTVKTPITKVKSAEKKPSKAESTVSAASASNSAVVSTELPSTDLEEKKPAKCSRGTGRKGSAGSPAAKKRKKTTPAPRGGRRGSGAGNNSGVLSEDDALLLALKMSEIEY